MLSLYYAKIDAEIYGKVMNLLKNKRDPGLSQYLPGRPTLRDEKKQGKHSRKKAMDSEAKTTGEEEDKALNDSFHHGRGQTQKKGVFRTKISASKGEEKHQTSAGEALSR